VQCLHRSMLEVVKATEVRQHVAAAYREVSSARQMADAMLDVVR
jgi:hypothetical protein